MISKNDPLMHFVGALDELNSYLGLVKAMLSNEDSWQFAWKSACNFLELTQKNLMKIMSGASDAEASDAQNYILTDADLYILEKEIDRLTKSIPKIRKFILPGKNIIEAQIQIARTITRRAERYFFALDEKKLNKESFNYSNTSSYLNKLSDYLFILSQQESMINFNFINQVSGI